MLFCFPHFFSVFDVVVVVVVVVLVVVLVVVVGVIVLVVVVVVTVDVVFVVVVKCRDHFPFVGFVSPRGRGVAAAPALELPMVHPACVERKTHRSKARRNTNPREPSASGPGRSRS